MLFSSCVFVLKKIDAANVYNLNISHLNIGSGTDISIHDLAYLLAEITGYTGNIKFELDIVLFLIIFPSLIICFITPLV